MKRRLVNIFFIIFCLAATSVAQEASVRGTITDEYGSVIPGARIDFFEQNGKSFSGSTVSDGSFRVVLSRGIYKVVVKGPPFTEHTLVNYVVPSAGAITLDVTLRCIGCETLDCPEFELALVEMPPPLLINKIQKRPLERLPTAPMPTGKTRKAKKNTIK